ncbi:MAG: hypothetical protein ABH934_00195 [Chloroflexota bacterium]
MAKKAKPERRHKEEVSIVPNFGYVRVLDRELQKQLDDLNGMKKLNPVIKKEYGKRNK